MVEVKFKFENEEAATMFLQWLQELGEENYWDFMRNQEPEWEGDITVLQFGYDMNKYLVTTLLGRLDEV